ncbi:hypothetical protein HGB13_00770, partial [bacterium]|nr:hypothetical protein [bacterium]
MESKRLRTKIAKLLSSSRKPEEGFAEVVEYEPRDFLERQHGNMYFVVEVASGSKNAISVGETVINAIKEEFYSDLTRNIILSFESALRKANEELSDLTSSGETDWIGKLNVICAIVSEGKLHLSKVGATEAYILRGEKITHISEDGPTLDENDDMHPSKTFSTITSGKLQHHDKILLSTSDLFSHITISGVKKILIENSPSQSTNKLKDLLKSEEAIGAIGTLIVEMLTDEELAKENEDAMDEIWIDEEEKQNPKEVFAGVLSSIGGFVSNTFNSIKNNISPKSTEPQGFENRVPEEVDKKTEKETKETAINDDKKIHLSDHNKDSGFFDFAKKYFKEFSFEKLISDIKRIYGNFAKTLKKKSKTKNFKYLLAAILVIFISVLFISSNYISSKNKAEAKIKYEEAVSLYEKAENALIYEARAEAKDYLNESKAILSEVVKLKYYQKEIIELASKIELAYKKVDGIYEVDANILAEINNGSPQKITLFEKNIYVATEDKKIIVINIETKDQEIIETDSEAKITTIVAQPTTKKILAFNENSELFELDTKTNEISKVESSSDGFVKADAISAYNSNIYLLSKEQNQIFRYTKLLSKYSSSSKYVNDNTVDLKSASSITIPGAVMTVDNTGVITKMVKGKRQEFSLTGTTVSLQKVTKMQSQEKDDSIYLLDEDFGVIVYKTNGIYQKTLTPKNKQ